MSLFLKATLFLTWAGALSAQSGAGIISVEELRNPLKGKSLRMILDAQKHLSSGQRDRGIQELRDALRDPIAMPYAIGMLGVEHLKTGQLDAGLAELEQAAHLLPGRPEIHSNLAYVLCLKGQTERGLQEVRKALQLDGGRTKTRIVLGMLLLQRNVSDAEGIRHLQDAAAEIPSAHLLLARFYERTGQAPEAEKERHAYTVTSMSLLAATKQAAGN